jgi:hypothetical protein
LNEEVFPDIWALDRDFPYDPDDDRALTLPGFYTGPPPSTPTYSAPNIPPANVLAQRIMISYSSYSILSVTVKFASGVWSV